MDPQKADPKRYLLHLEPNGRKCFRVHPFPLLWGTPLLLRLLLSVLLPTLVGFGLEVGEAMPQLRLMTARGQKIHVNEYAKSKGKKNLLFIFFRTGNCGICVAQLEEVANRLTEFENQNTAVLAISVDDAIVQSRTSERIQHKIPILLDPDGKTVKLFSVFNPEEKLSRPATFLIGPDQKVLYQYVGQAISDRPPINTLLEMVTHYSGGLPKARTVTGKQ